MVGVATEEEGPLRGVFEEVGPPPSPPSRASLFPAMGGGYLPIVPLFVVAKMVVVC